MPFTSTYTHYYSLGGANPTGLTHYPNLSPNITGTTLSDNQDTTDDGSVAIGDTMQWSASSVVTLIGVTDAGYPVIEDTGFYYIITNSGTLHNTPLVINTVDPYVMCFLPGTLIAIPGGERPVEDLEIGDLVLKSDGTEAAIKWIGEKLIFTRFGSAERLMPVRFAAGSLGNGLPHSDLTVTADHGMLVDGVICNAGALVNGSTITRVPSSEMGESYTVYHVETEAHEIILANGAAAETFIDNVSRTVFDNYAEFEALYGGVPEMEELPYPRANSARQVPVSIKKQLAFDLVA